MAEVCGLQRVDDGLWCIGADIRMAPGVRLPLRATIVALPAGGVAIVSPIALDDALAAEVANLGDVQHLIAPNCYHHLYLAAAAQRWPRAAVHLAPGLANKRPDVRHDHTLPVGLPTGLEGVHLEGAPALGEVALFHAHSRTLILTDFVFNMRNPEGAMTWLVLTVMGTHRRLAQSRLISVLVKDKAAMRRSVRTLLDLDFKRVLLAHGDIIDGADAKAQLAYALRRWC